MRKIKLFYDAKTLLSTIAMFFLLFYPFNTSISSHFFPNGYSILGSIVISLIILFLLSVDKKNIFVVKKNRLLLWSILLFLLVIINFRNYYFIENRAPLAIIFILYLSTIIVFSKSEKLFDIFDKVLRLFCIEHILFTIVVSIFPNFYLNTIYPYIANGSHPLARSQFLQGYNPGLTTHYTTNAIYLSISCLYFFSKLRTNRNKSNIILFLLSFISLMLTAKRGHLIFCCLSIVIYYFYINKEKISKKILIGITTIGIIILGVFLLSFKYTNILKIFERFENTSDVSSLLNGRDKLYNLAIQKWNEAPIFGHGWVAYTYFYHQELSNEHDKLYGIDYCSTHNVYLELLCDMGIVGLLIFIYLALLVVFINLKNLKNNPNNSLVLFCICYQIFFLLYCLSGNPLYDIQCYSIYFICIGINLYYYNLNGGRKKYESRERIS